MQINHRSLSYGFHSFDRFVLRGLQAGLLERHGSLPFHVKKQGLATGSPEDFLDRLAFAPGWQAYRHSATLLTLCTDVAVAQVEIDARHPHVAFTLEAWATDEAAGSLFVKTLDAYTGKPAGVPPALTVDWVYPGRHGHSTTTVLERVTDVLLPSAYPWLPGGLTAFVEDFLASTEPVTVFFGAPGVGKTRLIRHLLACMSQSRDTKARVMYTADPQIFDTDGVFAEFMTSGYDALVVEDADHLLKPRTDGNQNLHRFLAISDGFIQPQGRKLLFSTNLPSRLHIDEALLRPGRCFGCVEGKRLNRDQVARLGHDLGHDPAALLQSLAPAAGSPIKSASLAEIYAAAQQLGKSPAHGQELQAPAGHLAVDPA